MELVVLSAGAAQSVVQELAPAFEAAHGCRVSATFGNVGFQRDRLFEGADCDVVILTAAMIADLERAGRAVHGASRALGSVATGVAVRSGEADVRIATGDELRATFAAAEALYVADMQKATAGKHVRSVLERLGLAQQLAGRVLEFANGATAMAALAASSGPGRLGCTQATEILLTPGRFVAGSVCHRAERLVLWKDLTAGIGTDSASAGGHDGPAETPPNASPRTSRPRASGALAPEDREVRRSENRAGQHAAHPAQPAEPHRPQPTPDDRPRRRGRPGGRRVNVGLQRTQ